MNSLFTRRYRLLALCVLGACVQPVVQAQQATIYRCHALSSGQLMFQDKPCDQVAGTREAQKGSAGDIIPNAAPAPETDGPALTERYENYLDKESARRAAEAAATPAAAPAEAAGGSRNYGYPGIPAGATVDGYANYSDGVYPYPVYPPYFNRGRPPYNNGGSPSSIGPQPVPKPLPLPTSSFPPLPQRTAPPSSPPGHAVAREPNR
jgi:hypothetical protein